MKDEFKRASALSIGCCWKCDVASRHEDTSGNRQMNHQMARARLRRELQSLGESV